MFTFQRMAKCLVPLMMLAVTAEVLAQDERPRRERQRQGRRGGFGRFGGGGISGLLNQEAVQKALKMDEAQVQKVREIARSATGDIRENFRGLRDLPEEERREKFAELREKMEKATKEAEAKIKKELSAEQLKRLLGIIIQAQGVRSLLNDDVAEELEIDGEQKALIRSAFENASKERRELFESLRGGEGNRQEIRQKFRTLQVKSEKEAMAALSEEQKKEYEALKGEPVDLRRGFGRGRRGRGGDGARGRGRRGDREGGRRRPRRPSSDEPDA